MHGDEYWDPSPDGFSSLGKRKISFDRDRLNLNLIGSSFSLAFKLEQCFSVWSVSLREHFLNIPRRGRLLN